MSGPAGLTRQNNYSVGQIGHLGNKTLWKKDDPNRLNREGYGILACMNMTDEQTEIICPYCGTVWIEDKPKPRQVTSYQCLRCETGWSVRPRSPESKMIHVGYWEEWEKLEESDRIVYQF